MKTWQVFFVFLSLCGFAAALIPWIYHNSQTLTIEELNRNSETWNTTEPMSYTLRVFVDENGQKSTWVFRTENKQILAVSKDGRFLAETEGSEFLPQSVFGQIGVWLEYKSLDEKPPFITANFHPRFGYPLRSVLRRKSPVQRIEIQMLLETPKN